MTTVIVLTVEEDLEPTAVHEAVITALDLAGFRSWTSYLAKPDAVLPEAIIPPPEVR